MDGCWKDMRAFSCICKTTLATNSNMTVIICVYFSVKFLTGTEQAQSKDLQTDAVSLFVKQASDLQQMKTSTETSSSSPLV